MLVSRPEILVHLLYSSRWCGMLQCMLPFRPEILSVFLLLNFLWLFYFRCNQDMDNCDLMGFSAFAKLNGTKPKRHKTLFLFTDERKPFCATHYRQSYRNQLLYTVVGTQWLYLILNNQETSHFYWHQFWHKNDGEKWCHWNYFQIPRALSELPANWPGRFSQKGRYYSERACRIWK